VTDTWFKAIQNGHFATWPSGTVENVCKYLSKYDATSKGHMNQIRQNIRSTKSAVDQPAQNQTWYKKKNATIFMPQ
jgi:phosphoglucomutase